MLSEVQTQSIDTARALRGPVFTPLEWLVVAMGARAGSVPLALSPFGRALVDMLVGDVDQAARDRLEALRRAAGVARRCGWGMPAIEVGAFLRAGWSEDHLEALVDAMDVRPCENERRAFDPGRGARLRESRSGDRMITMEMH